MRSQDEGFAAGRALPLVALIAAAALGCQSKTGERRPPVASPERSDALTFRTEEQSERPAPEEKAEAEAAVPVGHAAAAKDVEASKLVATGELVRETVSAVEERPSQERESRLGRATRDEGRVPPPGTAGDEDAIQAAKRLAPERRRDWCVKGPAAFPELAGRLIMGTGSLSGFSNPALAKQTVSARARGGVARTLRTSAMTVLRGYLESAAGLQAAERGMLIETALKNVFRRVLVDAEIVDFYVDGSTGTSYALSALRTDLVKAAIRNEIERLAGSRGQPVGEARLRELLQGVFGAEPAAPTPEDVF